MKGREESGEKARNMSRYKLPVMNVITVSKVYQ